MLGIAILGLLGIGIVADLVSDDDDQEAVVPAEDVESGSTVGTDEFDNIAGGDGENIIFGRGETDFLTGGAGDDRIFGGDGDDLIIGEEDDDLLRGSDGDDVVLGGEGNDTLYGDAGNDTLFSEDTLDQDAFITSVRSGEEVVSTFVFENEEGEADTLFGGAGNDVLLVGGNDVASTGSGNDAVSGGFWMEPGEQAIVTDFEQGEDILVYNYDAALGEPEVSFDENEEGDAQFLINDEVVMVLEGVDFMSLSNSDVQLFEIDLTRL